MIRTLLVDDDPDQRENLEWAVRAPGREVITAESAKQAIEAIKNGDFDAVVTDLKMERDHSGLEVLRAAKEKNFLTQVIVVTAYGTPRVGVEAMRLGAFDYIERGSPGTDFLRMMKNKVDLALEFRAAKSRL